MSRVLLSAGRLCEHTCFLVCLDVHFFLAEKYSCRKFCSDTESFCKVRLITYVCATTKVLLVLFAIVNRATSVPSEEII